MVAGPIILAVVIVLILPIIFFVTGLAVAGIYSYLFPEYIDDVHEGSEFIELNN